MDRVNVEELTSYSAFMVLKTCYRLFSRRTLGNTSAAISRLHSSKWRSQLLLSQRYPSCDNPSSFDNLNAHPAYAFTHGDWAYWNEQQSLGKWSIIRLFTWNIDCKGPRGQARMRKAIEYLKDTCLDDSFADIPLVIFFQEMTPTYLEIIQKSAYIRSTFQLSNIDLTPWRSTFGTCSLIDRRLPVASVYRVPLESKAGRDALFVDVKLKSPSLRRPVIARLCNVHLESFNYEPRLRPRQLASVSKHLHAKCVHAGVVAGDFNPHDKATDADLHIRNALKDAYLEHGGKSGEGLTWGMHSTRKPYSAWHSCPYPSERLDKVLYTGNAHVGKPETIGRDLTVDDLGAKRYVSDHLGLTAVLTIK